MTRLPRFADRSTPPHLATLVLLAGISALTMNIFLPSLPGMAAWFGVPYALMQLSVALYLGLSAVLQVIIGPISDRFGRRPVLLVSLILFLIATLGTLVAQDATTFLVCRMAQAVVVAAMVLSRAIVRDMVDEAQAASMIGYVTMGMSIVPMVGPVIGGLLDENFGWHASFALLLVAGVIVLLLVWADLGETATPRRIPMRDHLRQYPGLLASPRFWGYAACAALASGSFYAFLGGAPYVGDQVFGLSSSQVGMLFVAMALGYAFGNFLSGRLSVRLGVNRMVLYGCLASALGLGLLLVLTLAGISHPAVFFGLMAPLGIGNGMVLPNANAGMLSVRPQLAGTASGLGGALMIGGGAALAALTGSLLGPGATELPLLVLMEISAIASVIAILLVMRRARRLGLE